MIEEANRIETFVDRLPGWLLPLVARLAGRTRSLALEPGWYFDKSEEDDRPATQLRRALWRRFEREGLTKPVTVRWYERLKLRLYLGNDLSKTLYVGGSFEPNEFVFLSTVLRPGMVFVDAGANEGVYSVFAARRVGRAGRVLAFEPSERERNRLLANLRANRVRNVDVRASALGEGAGEATLALAGYGHEGQNTIGDVVSNPNVETVAHAPVRVERLDDARLDRVDVIKLDVEGSELRVLRGARATLEQHRPILQLELEERALSVQGTTREEVVDFLGRLDYVVYVFDEATAQLREPDEDDDLSGNVVAAPAGWVPPLLAPLSPAGTDAHEPYVSVVATARNDNHGGDLLYRIQVFANGLAAQAERFGVPLELVLVEWNPPDDRPRLAEVIEWPPPTQWFRTRIVEVSPKYHLRLEHGDRLPLFQMIAKNVGIRRAHGRFVLATNVDVLLSDELMEVIATRKLKRGRFYRADRFDVDANIDPVAPVEDQLEACRESVVRVCAIDGTRDLRTGAYYPIYGPMTSWPGPLARWGRVIRFGVPFALRMARHGAAVAAHALRRRLGLLVVRLAGTHINVAMALPPIRRRSALRAVRLVASPAGRRRIAAGLRRLVRVTLTPIAGQPGGSPRIPLRTRFLEVVRYGQAKRLEINEAWHRERARVRLHTNACGDFTLLAREDWARLRGYPELQIFSMHLDSLLLYEAYYHGLRQVIIPGAVYHLEHESGFRPDDAAIKTLNARLERAAIPQLTNETFLEHIMDMYTRRGPLGLNEADWGFARSHLVETEPASTRALAVSS